MNDSATYQIYVMGTLGERWQEWFPGMSFQPEMQQGAQLTCLSGQVPDQSSLIGMLQTLVNLGLPILLVKRTEWE